MGSIFSTPSPNPSAPMSPTESSPPPALQSTDQPSQPPSENPNKASDQKPIESEQEPNKAEDLQKPIESADGESKNPGEAEEEEEEEEGECGFCLYMKGGGCKDAFIAWEDCIKEAEDKKEDIVEKCFSVTSALKTCMEAHSDYYEPLLQAEKAAEADAVKELEEEKAREAAGSSTASSESTDSSGKGSEEEESKSSESS